MILNKKACIIVFLKSNNKRLPGKNKFNFFGKKIYQHTFDKLKKLGFPNTGTENFGGVTATAGNIAIATGTLDHKLYIFDSKNGNILFSENIPYIGSAPPSTYLYENKQYIVLHSSGGSTLKKGYPDLVKKGNVLIAFKLKE